MTIPLSPTRRALLATMDAGRVGVTIQRLADGEWRFWAAKTLATQSEAAAWAETWRQD